MINGYFLVALTKSVIKLILVCTNLVELYLCNSILDNKTWTFYYDKYNWVEEMKLNSDNAFKEIGDYSVH